MVHFIRDVLGVVSKNAQHMVAATIRTVFVQPDAASAWKTWRNGGDSFWVRFARVAQLMDDAEDEMLAYLSFPHEHWHQIWSNNPLERQCSTQCSMAGGSDHGWKIRNLGLT